MAYPPHGYEDFSPGQVFPCGSRRITREDISAFAELSGDHTALHCDDGYAASSPFGGVVAHGVLNLAVATGLAYGSGLFEGTVLAVMSMASRFERPVFPGDEVTLRLEVTELDPRPRPDRGRVSFEVDLLNQSGKPVLSGAWTLLVRRGGAAPVPSGKAAGNPKQPD